MLWSNPEQTPQVETQPGGILWIECVTEVDQNSCFSAGSGSCQSRESEREASASPTADDLDQLTTLRPATQETIERRDTGRLSPEIFLQSTAELACTRQVPAEMIRNGGDELLGGRCGACHAETFRAIEKGYRE